MFVDTPEWKNKGEKKGTRSLNTGHAAFPHDSEPCPAVPLTNHRQEFSVYTEGQPGTKTKADAIKEEQRNTS